MKKLPKLRTNAQNHKNAPTGGKTGFFLTNKDYLTQQAMITAGFQT